MFDRKNAFSIEIKDPDNPSTVDPINSSIVVNDELFIFTENKIYRGLSAETIDPANEHPDTKHSYEKKYDISIVQNCS